MREAVLLEIEKLRRLFYLIAALRGDDGEAIRALDAAAFALPNHQLHELLHHVQELLAQAKKDTGCKLTDEQIGKVVRDMTTAGDGYIYIPKWFINEHWFDSYERIFTRWPHVPDHALVMFDSDISRESPYGFFVAEVMLFRDVATLWADIEKISNDGLSFRTRPRSDQHRLSSFLRTCTTVVYHFLEAYLNGLAFDVGRRFHDVMEQEDHDLLAEWDSNRKRRRFVAFERKVREYPSIVGKYLGRTIELGNDLDVDHLTGEGKEFRDALTHPAPHFPTGGDAVSKLARVTTVSRSDVKRLLDAAMSYVRKVEIGLGRDPASTAPWLDLSRALAP